MKKKAEHGQPRGKGPREVARIKNQEARSLQAEVVVSPITALMEEYRLVALSKGLKLPRLRWIVEGILEEKSPATVLGLPKIGKSWVSLELSVAVATGTPFLGKPVHKSGRVLYFLGEGHISKMNERVAALLKARGLSLDDLRGRLLITSRQVNLEDEATRDDLLAIVRDLRPTLVVFDPLARFLQGADENSAKDLRPILNWVQHDLCRHTAVVIDHHTDKKGASARGSGDIYGFVATQIMLKGVGGKKKFTVEIVHRNAEAPEPFVVKLDARTIERQGEAKLDTAALVIAGAGGARADKDGEKVAQAKALISQQPGISTNALASGLKVGHRRAARVARLAGAKSARVGKALQWGLSASSGFRDVTVA